MNELVSVIIPTYKGAKTITDLVNEIITSFQSLNFEIVIINDDSPDDSHFKLIDLQKKNKSIITYIKLTKNFGEYNAEMAGLRNCKGDIAVIIDDDFQQLQFALHEFVVLHHPYHLTSFCLFLIMPF